MTGQNLANILPAPEAKPPARPPVKQSSRQLRHLAQSIQLEESGTEPLVRFTLIIACVTCLVLLLWATFTRIDEVAAADGQVIPMGQVTTVQHLEGGIVETIAVKEGELVEQGQVLVKLSPAAALADLEQTRAREAALLIKAERLRAFAENRAPDFTIVGTGYQRLVADNEAIYHSQVQALNNQRAVTQAQIEQKRSDLGQLEDQRRLLEDQLAALTEQLKLREDLAAEKLVTKVQFLDTKREHARIKGELARVSGQVLVAQDSLKESENRLADQGSTTQKATMDDLGTVITELAQVQESIGRLEDRVQRLVVTTPVKGYVKGLTTHNFGAVIQPGGLVCEVVPVDRELKVEARVSTRDVGHLKAGQSVKIKVATYDFARYGWVTGKLETVSASSFLDEKGNPYFKAWISLDKTYVGDNPERFIITPGMTINAEIITGDKTLLQYMLKPVFTQLEQSFHER